MARAQDERGDCPEFPPLYANAERFDNGRRRMKRRDDYGSAPSSSAISSV